MEWNERIAYDVARGRGKEEVCEKHGLTRSDLEVIFRDSTFRMAVARHSKTLSENGVTFKLLAQMKAESYLSQLDDMIKDDETPAMVKLEAIKAVVKWAGLDNKTEGGHQTLIQNKIEIGWSK